MQKDMKNIFPQSSLFLISFFLLYSGQGIYSFSYDYSATTECLANPPRLNRGGGMIVNPEFRQNMIKASSSGGSFERILQKVRFQKGKLYSFSAWIQISEESETVAVVFRTARGDLMRGGDVMAKHGCWSLLKGGLIAPVSGLVDILFECKNREVGIWYENVSLQEFTMKQWKSHQEKSIDKVRKTEVKLRAIYANNTAARGAIISIKQIKSNFPFGCGMNHYILTSKDYQNWFASRFKFTTFTNEMKWYSTENIPGKENYTVPDSMLGFAKNNGIKVRGHNILWDNPDQQPLWVKNLDANGLKAAAFRRVDSVTRRYAGQVIGWDVMNEDLHYHFFESKFGENASAEVYARAYQIDPNTRMFMNEFNTIEYSEDKAANPSNYVKKLNEILSYPSNKGMLAGIGVQGHFGYGKPNLVYMRSALDILGATKLPVWITELDMDIGPNQAEYLEQILREGYGHPAVEGIIMFAGPKEAGFNRTILADENFKKTAAGIVVDKLISEWKIGEMEVVTDSNGFAQVSLFHGDYEFTVKNPETKNTFIYKAIRKSLQQTITFNISH
ncbi:endo-1,4-beta-xylanase 5-like [Euphorbia lathyris]|uniref:endo-1,4-beta-xylanase 5-like n=1 Tax=Euphorbia lathyris TaxID=212925 RepID=UPI00331431F2